MASNSQYAEFRKIYNIECNTYLIEEGVEKLYRKLFLFVKHNREKCYKKDPDPYRYNTVLKPVKVVIKKGCDSGVYCSSKNLIILRAKPCTAYIAIHEFAHFAVHVHCMDWKYIDRDSHIDAHGLYYQAVLRELIEYSRKHNYWLMK